MNEMEVRLDVVRLLVAANKADLPAEKLVDAANHLAQWILTGNRLSPSSTERIGSTSI